MRRLHSRQRSGVVSQQRLRPRRFDSIVKRDDDHLGNIGGREAARDEGAVGRAEAVRQGAVLVVADGSGVGVVGGVAPALVTAG